MIPFSLSTGIACFIALGATTLAFAFADAHPTMATGTILGGLILGVAISERRSYERDRERSDHADTVPARPLRTLIIGAGSVGRELARELEASGRYEIVGFVDDDLDDTGVCGRAILGTKEQTVEVVRRFRIEEVYVAFAPTWQERLAEELTAGASPVKVNIVPSPYESLLSALNVGHVGEIAVISLDTKLTWRTQIPKRVFDVCVSLAGLAIAAPAMALMAILIKRDSGPAVFVQERIGRGGRTFNLYKFRTMIPDAEAETGPVLAEGMADARLTRIGRRLKSIRLDELPQLWNVLRGDMSLVGPRPERPCFVTRFETLNPTYARRHDVRPGITGLAQIYGGYHTDWRDKLRFDLNYISRQSLLFDLRILLKTISVVLFARHK